MANRNEIIFRLYVYFYCSTYGFIDSLCRSRTCFPLQNNDNVTHRYLLKIIMYLPADTQNLVLFHCCIKRMLLNHFNVDTISLDLAQDICIS